jgi:hypothetical protein
MGKVCVGRREGGREREGADVGCGWKMVGIFPSSCIHITPPPPPSFFLLLSLTRCPLAVSRLRGLSDSGSLASVPAYGEQLAAARSGPGSEQYDPASKWLRSEYQVRAAGGCQGQEEGEMQEEEERDGGNATLSTFLPFPCFPPWHRRCTGCLAAEPSCSLFAPCSSPSPPLPRSRGRRRRFRAA